jgi:mannose-1-phosphate guanylyltransferase
MQALILAGGKGTRLRPLTVYTPKPIVPVLNRPFLLYQLEILGRAGIREIVLSLSYQPDKIEDLLGDGSEYGVELSYVTEPSPMGTGGAYKYAAGSIKGTTVVFNGDILTDVDLAPIVDAHRKTGADATLALVRVPDPSAYGLVETDDEGRILSFLEKPKPDQLAAVGTDTINAGIYLLEPSILDLIPKNESSSFEYNVFPAALGRGMNLRAYVLDEHYWRDIGTPASYLAAHMDFLDGRISGFEIGSKPDADIATTADFDLHSLAGDGCVIKPNARIVRSVLGAGVHVEERAVIENSVIWSHTRISGSSELRGTIVGRSCHIGRNCLLHPGSVLGDKASIPDYSRL